MHPTTIRRRAKHAEDDLQIRVAEYLNLALKPCECVWWHTPNGGKRGISEAARLKRMGVKPGIPDLTFMWPGGLGFIELKTEVGRTSKHQTEFGVLALHHQHKHAVARSLEDVADILNTWGIPLRATLAGKQL